MADHRESASWAVWEDDNISFPARPAGLHTGAVLIAINRGGHGPGSTPLPPWTNFHTARKHNDHFLAVACRDTPLWGGYMTDLLEERNGRLASVDTSRAVVDANVAALADELRLLQAQDPLLVLIGGRCQTLATGTGAARRLGHRPARRPEHHSVGTHPALQPGQGAVHGGKPERYRELVLRALDHPRVVRPWR
jgi:hypothetical protein